MTSSLILVSFVRSSRGALWRYSIDVKGRLGFLAEFYFRCGTVSGTKEM